MLFVTKIRSAGLSLLLTATMMLMTACSGGDEAPADSGTAGGDAGSETTGSDGGTTGGDDGTTGGDDGTTGGDDGTTGGDDGTTGGDDGTTGGDDGTTGGDDDEEPPAPIGNPIGDSIQIDHESVKAAVDSNLTTHIDGVEAALIFLEASNALTNLVEIFSDDEEDDDGGGEDESGEDEPAVEIDLSELRDDLLEVLSDRILVESTAVLSADGTELSYAFTPEYFCASDDTDENLSEEELAEQAEDEADCTERITNTPLRLVATSDAENDVNLTFLVGADDVEVFSLQIHDDMMSAMADLTGVKALLEVFIDAEDFEFPETMNGSVGLEVRNVGALQYDVRFAVDEAVELIPGPGQDTIAASLEQNLAPGGLSLDGAAGTISGGAEVSEVLVGIPWQIVVDIFWDDEGSNETECETNDDTGETHCWDVYVEGPEAPDVDGIMNIQLPGASGAIEVSSLDDVFDFTNLSLGNESVVVDVSGETILTFDLNESYGRLLNIKMVGDTSHSTRMEMSPGLEATAAFSMEEVKDSFQDLPEFMLNERLGVRMEADQEQFTSMSMMRDEEDSVEMQVSSGQLVLWSDAMEDDVVITAGQCMESTDDDELTEEEQDAQHDLFGGLYGASCSE